MTGFTPQMDDWLIIVSGVVQGLGLGLVFVPLSTVAFATLEARFRTDATSLFSLVRNIGSSIGISIVIVFLTRNTQINHAELSAFINPFNPMLWSISPQAATGDPTALVAGRSARQPAGADDLLHQRLQADDAGHSGRHPARAVSAQAADAGPGGRPTCRAHGLSRGPAVRTPKAGDTALPFRYTLTAPGYAGQSPLARMVRCRSRP